MYWLTALSVLCESDVTVVQEFLKTNNNSLMKTKNKQ